MTAKSLPPSAEFVRYVLDHRGPCTWNELKEETNRAESTLGDAIQVLDEEDILHRSDTSPVQYDLDQ